MKKTAIFLIGMLFLTAFVGAEAKRSKYYSRGRSGRGNEQRYVIERTDRPYWNRGGYSAYPSRVHSVERLSRERAAQRAFEKQQKQLLDHNERLMRQNEMLMQSNMNGGYNNGYNYGGYGYMRPDIGRLRADNREVLRERSRYLWRQAGIEQDPIRQSALLREAREIDAQLR
ncbi:hypothetical protein IJT93_04825 [bacterium]|nr:hypothetical protein [bacterium]